jgi:hypothetical protein
LMWRGVECLTYSDFLLGSTIESKFLSGSDSDLGKATSLKGTFSGKILDIIPLNHRLGPN